MWAEISVRVDGVAHTASVDTRTSLLDLLRERLGVTSPKKGCDHGQCGACTVLLDGRRVLSCLCLAVAQDGSEVTTAAGLAGQGEAGSAAGSAAGGGLAHPVQRAFLDRDAFQCGYCTPGQVCSAMGVLDELDRGWPSAASGDVAAEPELDDAEVAERMSGNLCRCGAYRNIVAAVLDAHRSRQRGAHPARDAAGPPAAPSLPATEGVR
jgi:xanthine dehydrogenase YagT iron-sulfur-binding subunit